MGSIHIDLFTTLDGVAQAPGGPEEDTDGGFAFGGWQAPLFDDVIGAQVGAGMQEMDALLLGRRTYDLFASYWPDQEGGPDGEVAELFNRLPKYVASRGTPELGWAGSTLLGPDLVQAVAELRQRHSQVHVIGSIDLVQTLVAERLFDQLNLWVHPIVLGTGKRVFPDGAAPTSLTLTEAAATSPNGAVLLRYALADGVPATGDMSASEGEAPRSESHAPDASGGPAQEPELVQVPAQGTAVVRTTASMSALVDVFDRSFGLLGAALEAQRLRPTGPAFARYHGLPAETVDVEVGYPVDQPVAEDGDVGPGSLPACRVARAVHRGSFDGLGESWGRLAAWIAEQGLTPAEQMWEVYLTEPTPETDPAELRTELNWPVS